MTINLEGPFVPDYDKDDTSGVALESLNNLSKTTVEKAILASDTISSEDLENLNKEVIEAISLIDYMVDLHLTDTGPHGISASTIPVNLVDNYASANLEETLLLKDKELFVLTKNIEPVVEANTKEIKEKSESYNVFDNAIENKLITCSWRDVGSIGGYSETLNNNLLDVLNPRYELSEKINISINGDRLVISPIPKNGNLNPYSSFVRSYITNGELSLLDFQPAGVVYNNNALSNVSSNSAYIGLVNSIKQNNALNSNVVIQSTNDYLGELYNDVTEVLPTKLLDMTHLVLENKGCILYYDIEVLSAAQIRLTLKVRSLDLITDLTDEWEKVYIDFPNTNNTSTWTVNTSNVVPISNYVSLSKECQLVGVEKLQHTLTWLNPDEDKLLSYATFKVTTKNYFTSIESNHIFVLTENIDLSDSTIKIQNCISKPVGKRHDVCTITVNSGDGEVGLEEGIIRDITTPLNTHYFLDIGTGFITLKVKDNAIVIDKHLYEDSEDFLDYLTHNHNVRTIKNFKRLQNDLGGIVDNISNRVIPFRDFTSLPGYKYLIKDNGYSVLHLNHPLKCAKYSDNVVILNNEILDGSEITTVDDYEESNIPNSLVVLTGSSGNIPITHGLAFTSINNYKSFGDVNFKPNGSPILSNFIKLDPDFHIRITEQEARFLNRRSEAYKRVGITELEDNFKYSIYSINRSGELGVILFTDQIGYCEIALFKSKLEDGYYVNNQSVNSIEFIGFMSKDITSESDVSLVNYVVEDDVNMDMYVHDNRPNYAFNYDEHFLIFPNVYGNNGGGLTITLEYLDKKPLIRNNIYQLCLNNEENHYYPLFIESMGIHYWNWNNSYRYGLIYTDNSLRYSEPLLNTLNNIDVTTVDYVLDVNASKIDSRDQLLIPKGVSCYINGVKYKLGKSITVNHYGKNGYVYLYESNDSLTALFSETLLYVGNYIKYAEIVNLNGNINVKYSSGCFIADDNIEYPIIANKTIKIEQSFNWFNKDDLI